MVGNHDIGFHYRAHPHFVYRFEDAFPKTSGVNLISRKGVHFVTVNSVAMEGDECDLCVTAHNELIELAEKFECSRGLIECRERSIEKYSRPIILQHFPTYRPSDHDCLDHDQQELETFRESWEVLSKNATALLAEMLSPRIAFSGHSHHYCRTMNNMGIEEYTLASFSWRNTKTPSFLLASFTPDQYKVEKCSMPTEPMILKSYLFGVFIVIGLVIRNFFIKFKLNQTKVK